MYPVLYWYKMKQAWKPVAFGGYYMCNPYIGAMSHTLKTNPIYLN